MVQEIMKPLVYYDFKEINDGEVAINKKRLEEILEEVYQAGYSDGSNCRPYITTTPWTVRSDDNIACLNNAQPREIHSTGNPIPRPDVVITCSNSESK